MLTIALALALTANVPAYRADAQKLFGGCEAEQLGPSSRSYATANWNATVTVFTAAEKASTPSLEVLRASARTALPGKLREEDRKMVLAGKETDVVRVFPAEPAGAAFGFSDSALLWSGTQARVITCTTRQDTAELRVHCSQVLAYLATKTPDDYPLDATPVRVEPRFLGHALTVPSGCQLGASTESSGRIDCPSSKLVWTVMDAALVPSLDRWVQESLPSLSSIFGGQMEQSEVACVVDGFETRCARLTKAGTSTSAVIYVGAVADGGRVGHVACAYTGKPGELVPVCNGLFKLK